MKLDYSASYVKKNADEILEKSYSFSTKFLSGDVASACTITALDADGADKSASVVRDISVSGAIVSYTLFDGSAGETYYLTLDCEATSGNLYSTDMVLEVYDNIVLNTKLGDVDANSFVTLKEADNYIKNIRGHTDVWDSMSMEGKKRSLIQATRAISKLHFINGPYYTNQALPFPDSRHDLVTGKCATPFSTTFFRNSNLYTTTYGEDMYNNDFFKYGTVHVTTGTPVREVRNITTSCATNGQVVVSPAFSDAVNARTGFSIFYPVDKRIKYAQIEQAVNILESDGAGTLSAYRNQGAKAVEIGDTKVTFQSGATTKTNKVCSTSKGLLSEWLNRSMKVLRS